MTGFGWGLPPGVSTRDIPGNRPEDEAAEAQTEREMEFYKASLIFYGGPGSDGHKVLRKAFLDLVPNESEEWLDDIDAEVEALYIRERIGENEQALHEASEQPGPETDPEEGVPIYVKVPESEWPDWATKAKADNVGLRDRLRELCSHTRHGVFGHDTWCPDATVDKPEVTPDA